MAEFKVIIRKALIPEPTVRWTNTYYVDAGDAPDAILRGNQILELERVVHSVEVEFVSMNVRVNSPLAPAGRQNLYNGIVGQRAGTAANRLPLFNVARIVLFDDLARSEQKYLRLPLYEGDIANGFLEAALVTTLTDDYCEPLEALGFVHGPQGEPIVGTRVEEAVQMRQLHWSRRTRPGFKRGYVPV